MSNKLFPGYTLPEVRALTWKAPYAQLMLHGKVETRVWNTSYRGLVLICCGLGTYSDYELALVAGLKQEERIAKAIAQHKLYNDVRGYAIAIGELYDTRRMERKDEDVTFVHYRPELFCHYYRNVQPIEPLRYKGQQGWRSLPEDIIRSIKLPEHVA